jgi:uncharacterized membrane protein
MAARQAKKSRDRPKARKDALSEMNEKLDRLETKIDKLRKSQKDTGDDVEESLEAAEETEKDVDGISRKINEMDDSLDKIEENMIRVGRFSISRHFTEIARGTAGAFIGVSLGMSLRWMPILAESLEWANLIAIMIFILSLSAVLLFKTEKDQIKKEGNFFVAKRITQLYVISLIVVILAFTAFNMLPSDPWMLFKSVIVGTYPAMSGAITFSIT